jgi:hypothetical protein
MSSSGAIAFGLGRAAACSSKALALAARIHRTGGNPSLQAQQSYGAVRVILVTVALSQFATQMLVPSKKTPAGW